MTPRRQRTIAALVATAALVGCTSEQSTVQTGTPPDTVTTPTTVPATTVPDSTPESAPSTTSAPPSTAAPTTAAPATTLPAGPANVNLAVLAGSGAGGWLNLGSWQRTAWQRPDGPDGPTGIDIEAGTTFTVTDLNAERAGTAGPAADSCFDDRVGPTITPAVPAPEPPGFGYGALAIVPPAWPLKPRPVTTTGATVAAYEALGEAAFAGEAVDPAAGDIEQLVIADLDGDGDDEALAVFESPASPGASAEPGDLASLLLIDTATRSASTVVRSLVASDAEGGFFILDRYRVIDVVDLNGDGRMEVAVHAWYFEGAAVLVYEYDGTTLTEVLAAGCGS